MLYHIISFSLGLIAGALILIKIRALHLPAVLDKACSCTESTSTSSTFAPRDNDSHTAPAATCGTCAEASVSRQPETDLRISVIIPARNEAANIAGIIRSLMEQDLKPYEIICADDESTDGTAGIAAREGARVINAAGKPAGWIGKTWACQSGAAKARGDILLFADADTRFAPSALRHLVSLYSLKSGAVSVQPYHTVIRFYEHFSLFFSIISVAGTGIGLPFVKKPAGMFGPVFMVGRELYFSFGGHEKVKSRILEDFSLGRQYGKMGIPVTLAAGCREITYRMYPGGLGELWQGWTKNFSKGAASVPFYLLLIVIIWITALTSVSLAFPAAASEGGTPVWTYAGFYVLMAAGVRCNSRKTGNFRWYSSLFFPVFLLGFHIIFFTSLVRHYIIRSVTWKGRKLST